VTWSRVALVGLLLFAGLTACADDGDLAEQVTEVATPSSLQACAGQLGLDPEDYEDFSDVTDLTDPDDFIAEFEDFSDEHPGELAELESEFSDEYQDDFETFTGAFTDEFDDVTGDATDVESTRELIIDTDTYTDLFVDFDDCAAFVRTQFGSAVLDQVDEPDEQGRSGRGESGTGR
jgi:hypothetical protein